MSKVIVALDFDSQAKALDFAEKIRQETDWVKVGLELFISSGPEVIAKLKKNGFNIFLDLKLFDIPNTVAGAVHRCMALGADMLTLHTLGGEQMIRRAVEARDQFSPRSQQRTMLLGVTLLTSLSKDDLPWPDPRESALIARDLAEKAFDWGMDGCICSGLEAGIIRGFSGDAFTLVTPGIRNQPAADDQKRTVTPKQAFKAGADYLVVGRPITGASNPVQALKDIKQNLTGS
ncbi:orotidine-5'-phosphate decarboxylase [Desulfonatronovibrio hydrogenovorans]|uniref:orotidine-5'-phosphate decarboxylase n=1 Tax=Desulfonatronovibrio hydrogenovorans TaxID=53245 RepID=UPI00048BE00A|nr:orotidine-5'-phosphate decarboxylase [Desulfonatronovibrio hydrogenovorans]